MVLSFRKDGTDRMRVQSIQIIFSLHFLESFFQNQDCVASYRSIPAFRDFKKTSAGDVYRAETQ